MTVRAHDDVLEHLRRARDHADRHYDQPLKLAQLAAVAALSPFHFQRLFTARPGCRGPRRACESWGAVGSFWNLTVTEVCHLVGFASLGSFSSRFRELVGETPSAYQRRWAATGAPHIPGCWVFMRGMTASGEKHPGDGGP